MSNDSSTGGPVRPINTVPVDDETVLDNILHDFVVGITGLPNDMVRPRWQPEPPKQPSMDTNWCAFGVINRKVDETIAITHNSEDDGTDTTMRHELVSCLASFYGPSAYTIAAEFRDNFVIPQNMEMLKAVDMVGRDVEDVSVVPELVNARWMMRADVPVSFRRRMQRTYDIKNLLRAEGDATTDNGITQPFDTDNIPPPDEINPLTP